MTRTIAFAAAVALSWFGFFVHNIADLPGQSLLSPESLYPSLVYVVLLSLWFVPQTRTAATWALLVWAVLHFIGGAVLSVLPLPILPFAPDQSLHHYLFHGLYGVLQVPLIVLCIARLRRRVPA
jgi:hypothetical protein